MRLSHSPRHSHQARYANLTSPHLPPSLPPSQATEAIKLAIGVGERAPGDTLSGRLLLSTAMFFFISVTNYSSEFILRSPPTAQRHVAS